MRNHRLWAIAITFTVGCGSSDGGQPNGVAGGASASGGFTQSAAGSASHAGAGPSGGLSNSAGNVASGGASDGGPSNSGGTSAGRGGATNGGRGGAANGGRGGAPSGSGGSVHSGGGGSSGAPATAGTGGCVQNLACKLTAAASSGDLQQDCVDRINQFRTQCACLPPLARGTDGEACANQMAEYDAAKNTAHAGYTDKICTPSGAQNSCPGYSSNNQVISLCLQQMWDEGPPPTNPCDGDCFQMYGHYINMTTKTSTKVACGFFTTSAGKVWSVQNFLR
ncbi:MAG TPA: CAP domain-containing protein [Polyangiaceae bacterium]|nr:CAP domain-containing protein [Polyangiaceae bacterium]